jgi:proteic killer suppression protein
MQIKTCVTVTRAFERQIKKIPEHIKVKVSTWIFLVETCGISEVMRRPGFHVEPLKGTRLGQRSIRLNRSYRLIYAFAQHANVIKILEVNKHDY